MKSVRIGVLGAAQIVNMAMIKPAGATPGVQVDAIAAREIARAQKFSRRYGLPKAYGSYSDLLADAEVDAVYIPLPPSLHGAWTTAALDAGKHVLIEKPFTANADEAATLVARAEESGLTVMEAFHSVYHPVVDDLRELVATGTIGTPLTAHGVFSIPIPPGKSTRWNEQLGGGRIQAARDRDVPVGRSRRPASRQAEARPSGATASGGGRYPSSPRPRRPVRTACPATGSGVRPSRPSPRSPKGAGGRRQP